ncbi:phosphoribosylanthranilate isomerase [Lacrimispora sp. 210928-DFI.3.58]|uniref:phosphoribosylanthranilate isomerase n=1 Tax=Lacrimispora sp. 210928-DFI.3.58 TaxID=2883214 RepID=UPI0015B59315|nr:phosphoribosylanthranilate isomerase [Lacrimispora sp. 210928-DFI.3.58]MCB7320904.1 phosphoribosylanthranilate isomerase [Lacrimispora sp. 210928-DFI.3.58]
MNRETCKIKICGLSRPEDIEAANEIGPDYIGFVFAKSSRQVTYERAARLKEMLDGRIKAVGVFVNALPEEILALSEGIGGISPVIDMIQLHGDEDEDYIKRIKECTSKPIIKAVRVRSREDIIKAQALPCDYLLLDTFTKGQYGGSGQQFDWSMIPKVPKPYFLAGGICMDNIRKAADQGAFCIDVSSAVETNGKKDRTKMKAIVEVLRNGQRR